MGGDHAVDKKQAMQMVDLMLNDSCLEATCLEMMDIPLLILISNMNQPGSWHHTNPVRNGKATLSSHHHIAIKRNNFWIDQTEQAVITTWSPGNRTINQNNTTILAYLGGGDSHATGLLTHDCSHLAQ